MRAEFALAMLGLFEQRGDLVFLTTDLGYQALEAVAKKYGERFINAGVAEQNAISLAAGLAREGQLPWVYSTVPFVAFRPYEQIRNNICLHRLPVKLVGNGGGYGFGIMGPTHHALEDVGVMRVLPNMRIYLPVTTTDVPQVVQLMAADPRPNYLRLNAGANIPEPLAAFAPWRRLKCGPGCLVLGMGPVLQNLYDETIRDLREDMEIWAAGVLPLHEFPAELTASIREKRVVVIEEHYAAGGLGEALAHHLLSCGLVPRSFTSIHALGYPSSRYGSQRWHQEESGLAGAALRARLAEVIHG